MNLDELGHRGWSPEQEALRASARTFVEREVRPNIDAWEASHRLPRELHRSAAEHGFLGVSFPEDVGGSGGGLIDSELKRFFARARPGVAEMLRHASGYSFPSGHAMGSTVLFASLSYLAIRTLPRWRWKSAAMALGATFIVFVSLSRVYLGVHWISDVGAGITAGLLWTTMTTVAYETSRRIRLIRARRKPLSS